MAVFTKLSLAGFRWPVIFSRLPVSLESTEVPGSTIENSAPRVGHYRQAVLLHGVFRSCNILPFLAAILHEIPTVILNPVHQTTFSSLKTTVRVVIHCARYFAVLLDRSLLLEANVVWIAKHIRHPTLLHLSRFTSCDEIIVQVACGTA